MTSAKVWDFLTPSPLVTVTLTQLNSTVVCFWGTPLPLPVQTSYVHAPLRSGGGGGRGDLVRVHYKRRLVAQLQQRVRRRAKGLLLTGWMAGWITVCGKSKHGRQ